MSKTLTLVTLQLVVIVLSKTIPPFIKLCKRNDPELNKCFIQAFEEIRPNLKKGIPELDLPPGESLHYPNLSAGTSGSVSVQGETWNQIATGLMDVKIENLSLDLDNAKFSASLIFPQLRLEGDYKFLGKILLFTIDTIGKFDINCTDLLANVTMDGKLYTKNTKEYIEFENYELLLHLKKGNIYFSNVIKGNPALTDTLNQAINQNLESVVDELSPIFGRVFGAVAQMYFNKFFRTFSVDELFPRD